jgi:hypothetical protein
MRKIALNHHFSQKFQISMLVIKKSVTDHLGVEQFSDPFDLPLIQLKVRVEAMNSKGS